MPILNSVMADSLQKIAILLDSCKDNELGLSVPEIHNVTGIPLKTIKRAIILSDSVGVLLWQSDDDRFGLSYIDNDLFTECLTSGWVPRKNDYAVYDRIKEYDSWD